MIAYIGLQRSDDRSTMRARLKDMDLDEVLLTGRLRAQVEVLSVYELRAPGVIPADQGPGEVHMGLARVRRVSATDVAASVDVGFPVVRIQPPNVEMKAKVAVGFALGPAP